MYRNRRREWQRSGIHVLLVLAVVATVVSPTPAPTPTPTTPLPPGDTFAPTSEPTTADPTPMPTPSPTRAEIGEYTMAYYTNELCEGNPMFEGREYLTHTEGECYVAYPEGGKSGGLLIGTGFVMMSTCEDREGFDLQRCNTSDCAHCEPSPFVVDDCMGPDTGMVPTGSSAKLVSVDCASGSRPPVEESRTQINFYNNPECEGDEILNLSSDDWKLDFCSERHSKVINCPEAHVGGIASKVAAHCVNKSGFLERWIYTPEGTDIENSLFFVTYEDAPGNRDERGWGFMCNSNEVVPNEEWSTKHVPTNAFFLPTKELSVFNNGGCAQYWEAKSARRDGDDLTEQTWEMNTILRKEIRGQKAQDKRKKDDAGLDIWSVTSTEVKSGWMKIHHGMALFPDCDSEMPQWPTCPKDEFCPGFNKMFTSDSLPTDERECTTTTTSVTTSTVTILSTTTTTTTYVPRRCEDVCRVNGHPWYVKCVWAICGTCLDCTNVLVRGPPPPPPLPPATYTSSTSTTTTSTTTTTTTTTTTSRPPPPPPPVTSTVTTTTPDSCRGTCYSAVDTGRATWGLLCDWDVCNACRECDPTSTSSTSTTSTTTTATTSTTTSCDPNRANGGDICASTTTTILSTTTTSMTTTTTTTTTTWFPCLPPSGLYPIANCTQYLDPGEVCVADTIAHACVEEASLVFECPAMNPIKHRIPRLLQGMTPKTRCRVCDLVEEIFNDSDPRQGLVQLDFTFGPNSLDGQVNEDGISAYQIWYADGCGHKLMRSPVMEIPVDQSLWTTCCTRDAYSVPLRGASLPFNRSTVYVMVVPVVYNGSKSISLSVGQRAGIITDYWNPSEAAYFGRQRIGGARRIGSGSGVVSSGLALLSLFCAAACWPQAQVSHTPSREQTRQRHRSRLRNVEDVSPWERRS